MRSLYIAFRSNLEDIVYPDDSGEPCVLQYRLAFTSAARLLVVVHLVHTDSAFVSPVANGNVRDQLLNRILNDRLSGIPLDTVRLAVTDSTGSFEYAIEVDVDDYIRRGNPYDASEVGSSGARLVERISIVSANIIVGRTRVQTIHAVAASPSPEVASAIA